MQWWNFYKSWQLLTILAALTCDLWDIWSGWWGDMTNPTKRHWQRHLENIFKQQSWRLDLWDIWVMRRHDLSNTKTMTKTFGKAHSKSYMRDLWPFRRLFIVIRRQDLTNKNIMTKTKTMTATKTMAKTILETCDIRDTDYNSDN